MQLDDKSIVISIDGMGGDGAPEIVVEGMALALKQHTVKFLLYGDESKLNPLLSQHPALKECTTLYHTSEVILPATKPSSALRSGKKTSMGMAIEAVKEGRAQGVVSAGNTGAYMALSMLGLRLIPGIHRPAICTQFPTIRGQSTVLDLGANVECSPQNLVQFAIMGEFYAREVLGITTPSVGLLNVGSEETKGNSSVKEAALLIRESKNQNNSLIQNFYGFIEGDDIAKGTVDVVVTDGFTGNVALKTTEGTAKMVVHLLKESFQSNWRAKIGYLLAKSALEGLLKQRLDPRHHNGAMFFGLNGVVIKSHGGTDSLGFCNAIHVAIKIISLGLNEKIRDAFATRIEIPTSVLGSL